MVVSAAVAHESEDEALPAWSLPAEAAERIGLPVMLPEQMTRDWAWGDSTGAGVRVRILDSGIETEHPLIGRVERSVAVVRGEDGELQVVDNDEGDLCGHGHRLCGDRPRGRARRGADECPGARRGLHTGGGEVLLRGLVWAIEQGFQVVNMSLSTTRTKYAERLHELADRAYFRRAVLVASAHFDPTSDLPAVTRPHRMALSGLVALLIAAAVVFPAHLDLGEAQPLRGMLTTMSLHGLPGMAVGLFVNGLILGCATMTCRRLVRTRT